MPTQDDDKAYKDFRFRVKHDQLLRQQLKHAKATAVAKLAANLGYVFNLDLLLQKKRRN